MSPYLDFSSISSVRWTKGYMCAFSFVKGNPDIIEEYCRCFVIDLTGCIQTLKSHKSLKLVSSLPPSLSHFLHYLQILPSFLLSFLPFIHACACPPICPSISPLTHLFCSSIHPFIRSFIHPYIQLVRWLRTRSWSQSA